MKTVTSPAQLIDDIGVYLSAELAAVERHMDLVLESDTALIREVGTYVRATHGKRIRPMLVLLAAKACGYEGGDHTKVAAALEMIHTATLLHDDVIDRAPVRRGRPTVNARWGDDVAILIADFLYSHAFKLAMQVLSPAVLSMVCDVAAKMCEGEMFQIEKRDCWLTRDDYLRIVRNKTAYLFSACTGLAGILAKAHEADTASFTQFGLNFGIAFQITDDTLDLVAQDADLGKQHGTDVRNGKQTLPIIHTFESASEADKQAFSSHWNNGRELGPIMTLIRKYHGVEIALGEARKYADAAKQHLEFLKPSKAAEFCWQLSDYVVQRGS